MTVREVVALLGISFEVVELRQAQCGLVLTLDVQLPLAVAYGGEAAVLIVEVVDRRVCHARSALEDGPDVRAVQCHVRLRFDPRVSTQRRQQRSEEHTSELQSRGHIVCRLLLEKKNLRNINYDFFS